jgi:ATP adenylyltransferase
VGLDRIWAAWRAEYVAGPATSPPDEHACVFCALAAMDDDREALVLERSERAFTIMNLYPYGSGHLMVAPLRHVGELDELDDDEVVELARAQRRAVVAVKAAYAPDGVNLGANLGRAAGAGVPGHVHLHVVPRWSGDTNFMTSVAGVRVLPEALGDGYDKLRAAWPR